MLKDELETYRSALAQYHLHPESKFRHGGYRDHGLTQRRHIVAQDIRNIGKEANCLEERTELEDRPKLQIEYGTSPDDERRFIDRLRQARKTHTVQAIASKSGISSRQLRTIMKGEAKAHAVSRNKLCLALYLLDQDHRKVLAERAMFVEWVARQLETTDAAGKEAFSALLGMRIADMNKVLSGKANRKLTKCALEIYRTSYKAVDR